MEGASAGPAFDVLTPDALAQVLLRMEARWAPRPAPCLCPAACQPARALQLASLPPRLSLLGCLGLLPAAHMLQQIVGGVAAAIFEALLPPAM